MDTVKIIDTQQKFANSVYQDFISKRFGITTCSSADIKSTYLKKQLCDWENSEIKVPEIISITSEIFIPSSNIDPCADTNAPDWCFECSNNLTQSQREATLKVIKQIEDDLEQLEEYKANIITDISVKEAEAQGLQDEIDELLLLIAADQLEKDTLQAEYDANCPGPEPYCTNLLNQITDLEARIGEREAVVTIKQSELTILQAEITVLTATLETTITQIEELQLALAYNISLFCGDDGECILFEVVDSNGDPVKDFELYIDRIGIKLTNSLGQYFHTFTNASTITDHTLQLCYCFSTAGNCRQQKITITIQAEESEPCKDLVPCNSVEITQTIIGQV